MTVDVACRSRQSAGMTSKPVRPESPCVALCSTALGDEICRGCGRTFTEVANWVAMTEAEREAVWQRLERTGWYPATEKARRGS